jgi:hypothetical protein
MSHQVQITAERVVSLGVRSVQVVVGEGNKYFLNRVTEKGCLSWRRREVGREGTPGRQVKQPGSELSRSRLSVMGIVCGPMSKAPGARGLSGGK